ncbi:MAG: DUF711 family protein [Bacteroidales bacterium]|jgi:uncharacterized protein (UPF0210 family)|nr:DUF711 family protein [Bacteroidales bacterium]
MIRIRSVTYHLPKNFAIEHFISVGDAVADWTKNYSKIRTRRLSLYPLTIPLEESKIKQIALECSKVGIRWFNIPIDPHVENIKERKILFNHAFSIIRDFSYAFINILAVKNNEINYDILSRSTKLIQDVSSISSNGCDNFRLGFSNNVLPDGSFFPFTMSSGDFSFSIALELTQEINTLLLKKEVANMSLSVLKKFLIDTLSPEISAINNIAENIAKKNNMIFKGFDFSLAPIIEENGSIFPILQTIGLNEFGFSGSMFTTAYLTDLLKSFGQYFKMVGFSGVMYSLLEDIEFCNFNNNKGITIEQLTAVSTLCGCGVDMVPVYGSISTEELLAIFLDIAAISCRLKKPLGIRILPIPRTYNHQEHYTLFSDDADFISNTKIVAIDSKIINYSLNKFLLL